MKSVAVCYSDDCCKKYNGITFGVEILANKKDLFCHQCNSSLVWHQIGDDEHWSDYAKQTNGKRKKHFRHEILTRDHL